MEAKTSGRLTIKILSEHFVKEMKSLKETIAALENRLNDSDGKVKILENKLAKKEEVLENIDEIQIKCKICEEILESKKSLRKHMKESHQTQIKCFICEKAFNRNSDLETHIEECHEESERHKCDKCEKKFALKWRLKKHIESHSKESNKFCHFFNNGKMCPFEKIGCMFLHQPSASCYFGKRCRNKLCQYKHIDLTNHSEEMTKDDLKDNFDQLTEM